MWLGQPWLRGQRVWEGEVLHGLQIAPLTTTQLVHWHMAVFDARRRVTGQLASTPWIVPLCWLVLLSVGQAVASCPGAREWLF